MGGRGVVMVLFEGGGMFILGAYCHSLENSTLYCVRVGLMGLILVCVFVILFRTLCSFCGVCKFFVGIIWMCMHMVDVSDGYVY